jgi:diamine N-acetyltransferase
MRGAATYSVWPRIFFICLGVEWIMKERQPLEGKYVNLRPLAVTDAEITCRWRQSARARLLNVGAATPQQQAQWIAGRPASEYNYVIELKDGTPVGMLSLVGVDLINKHAESGRFLIGEEEAVKGVPAAVEAMQLLYVLAFEKLGLHRVYGTVVEDNKLMIKWQKYFGMKEEGRLRSHYFIDGRFQDAIVLGLLEEEYRQILPRMNALIEAGRFAS